MKPLKIFLMGLAALCLLTSGSFAGDFDWMKDFNIKAETDLSDLKARLEARFKIGELKIKAVLEKADGPADAYALLRLGEMSKQPMEKVMERYHANKGKGWGVLAKSLGIKPGSKAFHALKQGQDLYDAPHNGKGKEKSKEKGKEKKKK